ncbi:hypothetical protein [Pseudomonas sp. CGJS7]|uniref:hypothetical protein n=1 Tax=Pseudomonas sp. CGJS7 TaxID=3109348 RepID=UPI003009D9D8
MRIVCLTVGLLWAASAWAAKPAPQVPAQLAATHGYVYVNFPKGSGTRPGTTGSLSVVSTATGAREETLDARSDPGDKAFGRWLPAGQYRLARWSGQQWGEYPGFEVQAGRVTDLGSLVPIQIGGYELVVLPLRPTENAHDIDAALNQFGPVLKSAEPLRWQPSTPPKPFKQLYPSTGLGLIADLLSAHDRKVNKPSVIGRLKAAQSSEEFLQLARSVTPPLADEPAEAADGTLYFGADLGQIRVRRADAQWSGIGIDTLRKISAVERVGETLLAGSDDSILRRSDDQGATWTVLKSFGATEAVIDIDRQAPHWLITTGRQVPALQAGLPPSLDRITVYVASNEDLSDLHALREFPVDIRKTLGGWPGPMPQSWNGSYFLGFIKELHRLDLQSMQWKTVSPPSAFNSFRIDAKTGTVTVLVSAGAFSKIFVSSDRGDSWKKVGRPPYVITDVQFDSADIGYATRWNMNAFSGVWELYTFDPKIDDWHKRSEAPFNCKPWRVSPRIPLLCVASDGSVLSQHEQEWTVEASAQ